MNSIERTNNEIYFFFNDTATTEIYTLSLHDALPISQQRAVGPLHHEGGRVGNAKQHAGDELHRGHQDRRAHPVPGHVGRSEEHTSELQSRQYLVCRLLLEKKK